MPGAVTINGFLTPNYGAFSCENQGASNYPGANITDTFWRSMENLTVNPVTDAAQYAPPNTLQWGVSQGAPLRHIQVNGDLELVDSFCGNANGGFMADIVVTGNVNPCSQQQWFTRNSTLGSWNGAVWNMVFAGVEGAPAQSYPKPPYTVLPTTPVSREKLFLYVDVNGSYKVFAPAAQRNSRGTTWAPGSEAGRSIAINDFFIARPSTPIQRINAALNSGKKLILTPVLLQVGKLQAGKFKGEKLTEKITDAENPTTLSDMVLRIAMTVPITPNVAVQGAGTVFLDGNGSITHVINGVGAAVNKGFPDQLSPVTVYP